MDKKQYELHNPYILTPTHKAPEPLSYHGRDEWLAFELKLNRAFNIVLLILCAGLLAIIALHL